MGDLDIHAVRERVETVEKRLAAMQEAGVDTSPLRAQLAFAHTALREVRLNDADAICEDVLTAAKRLAELGQVSTETLRRVRVSRAQLADEVRAAIEDQVRQQVPAVTAAPVIDPALVQRLEALDRRLAQLESRPAPPAVDVEAAIRAAVAAVPAPDIDPRLEALGQRLAELESRPAPAPVDVEAAIRAAVAAVPAPDIDQTVRKAVAEAVPAQASELLREAISKLPTRDDLAQIADTLRADLDWRLERAAAEHGWCSLADVQTTVRKALAEQEPGSGAAAAPVSMARLEAALTEFVQQTREQQERLIQALADRVAAHTAGLTKKLMVRESEPAPKRHETEELKPSSDASASDFLATATASEAAPPHDPHLDIVPAEIVAEAKKQHGSTTLFTKAITGKPIPATTPAVGDDLHELVTREVEKALTEPAVDSTMPEALGAADDTLPTQGPPPAVEPETTTLPPPVAEPTATHLEPLVAAEVARQLAHTLPVQLPPSDADLARILVRVLPQVLADDAVRTELFAVLSLEAAAKPGVLGELTGLRRYLKRELAQVAEELAHQQATVPT